MEVNYTTYYCRECGMRKGVEYEGVQEPIVKCPTCKYYMRRALPNWLREVKKHRKELND